MKFTSHCVRPGFSLYLCKRSGQKRYVNLHRAFVHNLPTTVKKRAVYLRCVISRKYLYSIICQCFRFHYELLNTFSRN